MSQDELMTYSKEQLVKTIIMLQEQLERTQKQKENVLKETMKTGFIYYNTLERLLT